MRPNAIALTLSLAVAFAAGDALATRPPAAHAQPPGRPGFDVEQRLAELVSRVGLDAGQTQQARVILTDARRQLEQARAELRGPDAERAAGSLLERRRAILWQVEDRLWAMLTCVQKDAFRLYVRERLAEQRTPFGGGPGSGHGGHGAHGPEHRRGRSR